MCLATVDATTLFCCPSQVVGISFLKRTKIETYSTTWGTKRVWQLAAEVLKYLPMSSLESVERGCWRAMWLFLTCFHGKLTTPHKRQGRTIIFGTLQVSVCMQDHGGAMGCVRR